MARRAAIPPEAITGLDVPVPAWLEELCELLPAGRQRDCCKVMLSGRRICLSDFEAIFARHGADPSSGVIAQVAMCIRDHLLGSGWHIATLGGGAYELRPGEDAERFARRLSVTERVQRAREIEILRTGRRPDAKAPAAVSVAAPCPEPQPPSVLRGPRKPKLPLLPKGRCQHVGVFDGTLRACGADADGTYCPRHRAASAGVPYREGVWG